jgi:hypothetical protein
MNQDHASCPPPVAGASATYPRLPPQSIEVLSRDPNVYAAHPDILLSRAGRLLAVWRETSDHCSTEGWSRLMLAESTDAAKSWSVRVLNSEQGWNCPRISQIADGRILIVCDQVHGGFSPGDVSGEMISSAIDVMVLESIDDGRTFSAPRLIKVPGFLPDRVVQRDDGILMLATHRPDQSMPAPKGSPWYVRQDISFSADGGKRWGWDRIVARVPGLHLCEASVARIGPPASRRYVCYMRENSGICLPTYRCDSEDGGATWSAIKATRMVGHRPTAGQLASGKLLITYRNVQGPESTMAYMTNPDDEASARFLLLEPGGGDCGYNGWVQLPDGRALCVFYSGHGARRKQTPKGLYDAFVSWGVDPEQAKTFPLVQIKLATLAEHDFLSEPVQKADRNRSGCGRA